MLDREICEIGKIEVNYLSAQFPGPSAPRDFVAACLTSIANPHDDVSEPQTSTRQFSIISRPVLDHPECPDRQGYVRGQYESLEFIREIPAETNPPINRREGGVSTAEELKRAHSVPNLPRERDSERMGRKRGKTITSPDRGSPGAAGYTPRASFDSTYSNLHAEDPEKNPVEWIMITRSDPGGSVPRWLVERGTPGSIVKDAEKFLDWVVANDELAVDHSEEDVDAGVSVAGPGGIVSGSVGHGTSITGGLHTSAGARPTTPPPVYTPSATASLATPTSSPPRRASPVSGNDGGSNTSSFATFTTAPSTDAFPGAASPPSSPASSTHPSSIQEERELSRLLREKSRLSARRLKEIEKEEKKRIKQQEQEKKLLEKQIRDTEKREEKHRKDMEKVKRKEERRERKDGLKEVRELKSVVEVLSKENMDLKTRVEKLEGADAEGEKNL